MTQLSDKAFRTICFLHYKFIHITVSLLVKSSHAFYRIQILKIKIFIGIE
jgi:hypothetical protein